MRVGDLAARTGLTVRTLHHYDSLGLVVPSARTAAGHREYDDGDVRRLYRVVALRRLGFALGDIAALLDAATDDPRALLERQLAETDRRIEAERDVRVRLEGLLAQFDEGAEPTTDDLLRAVEAMTMVERYYTPEQLETLARRREELGPEGMEQAQRDWAEVYADVDALREEGVDPADPRAQAVAARARALLEQFTGGDPEMYASLKKLYDTEGAERASRGMVSPERAAYLDAVMRAGRSDG